MFSKEELKDILATIVSKGKSEISDPIDYQNYLINTSWIRLEGEIKKIESIHNGHVGVYIIKGIPGDDFYIEGLAHQKDKINEKILYIGKSKNVGARLKQQFYQPNKSRVIKNAKKLNYAEISELNPHNHLDFKQKPEPQKLYITEIHIFIFDDDNKGLAGRDICEILFIQKPDEYPMLNREFAYRETGLE
ncbi:hypothetical protein PAESOLCIP111_01318 [Paenibacillus solanacearum]|uniref:GIY-YIG domain-containing protein n=1 Tax=Paenibacillus solanacearum TaxID=2048548 RepID=A0A916JX01_9BACL|nr:hypothetical protein [Paenibacillus solanacearum]CAG7610999.1 hypothetical protein PAESOLCIP111_01318 [Paenibacillus solanacearum]